MATSPTLGRGGSVPRRRFSIGDAMILTAGLAVAMLPPGVDYVKAIPTRINYWNQCVRHLMGWRVFPEWVSRPVAPMLAEDVLNFTSNLLTVPLGGMTLAGIGFRLRRPRPAWPEVIRQPGFVAYAASVLGFVIFLEANYFGVDWNPGATVASTVAVAWALLAAFRRWHAEAGWIDRLGRGVGSTWIIAAILDGIERST